LEIIRNLDDKNKKRAGDYDVACTLFPFIFFLYSSYNHAPNLALGNGAAK
jgi:hypothetical protein